VVAVPSEEYNYAYNLNHRNDNILAAIITATYTMVYEPLKE
jgi:hypothetical protein